jgi:hypothetical protein
MKFNTFIKLLADGFVGSGIVGVECIIVAECASTQTFASIPVGAGKAGIHHNFLQAASVLLLKVPNKGIVSFLHWRLV